MNVFHLVTLLSRHERSAGRTGRLSRPDGSAEPSPVTNCQAEVITSAPNPGDPGPFAVGQRASMPTVDVAWRVGKPTILAAAGRDRGPSDAQSMFAKTGKPTPTWQTYFR